VKVETGKPSAPRFKAVVLVNRISTNDLAQNLGHNVFDFHGLVQHSQLNPFQIWDIK